MATGRHQADALFNLAEKVLSSSTPQEFEQALKDLPSKLQKKDVQNIIEDLFAQYSRGEAGFEQIKTKLKHLKAYYASNVIDTTATSGYIFGEAWVVFCQKEFKKLAEQNPAEMKESDYQARYKKIEELKNFRQSMPFSREGLAAEINEMENHIAKLSPHLLLDFFPRPSVFVIRAAIANLEKGEYKGVSNKEDKLKQLEEAAVKEENIMIPDIQNVFRKVISNYSTVNKGSIIHFGKANKKNTATDTVKELDNIHSFNELAKKVPELFASSGFGTKSFNTLLLYAILQDKRLRDILKIPETFNIPENVYKDTDKKKINKTEMQKFINTFKVNLLQWNQVRTVEKTAQLQQKEKESKQHFELPNPIEVATNMQLRGERYSNLAIQTPNKDKLALAKAAITYCIADAYAGDTSHADYISEIKTADPELATLHHFLGICACAPATLDNNLNLQFLKFVMNTDYEIDDPDILILLALELSQRAGSFTLQTDPGLVYTKMKLVECVKSIMQDRNEHERNLDLALEEKQKKAISIAIKLNSLTPQQYADLTTRWGNSLQRS
jgi:hypothetical protein